MAALVFLKDGPILDSNSYEFNGQEYLGIYPYITYSKYQNKGFIKFDKMYETANKLIEQYDVRSGEGAKSITRGMSGGNQQKAIIAREVESNSDLLIAVQPTRGLDVGAIEFIHKQLVKQRDENKAVLLVSLELDEVMNVSDRILVMYEG